MGLIDKIKQIEKYMCDNYEKWDLDNPVEEGYFEEYKEIQGASDKEIKHLEKDLSVTLVADFKELYRYKNGSGFFSILHTNIGKMEVPFCLMSLNEIKRIKESFQNKNALLSDFPDYYSEKDIEKMKDSRIKPYLFNKNWLPFAQYCDSCYLMLDFAPSTTGKQGQVICYIHDPDEIVYVAESITDLVMKIAKE